MFSKNVEFSEPMQLTSWRKIAIGTWRTCGDPSVYGFIEIDATAILDIIVKYKEKGLRITPTVVIAKAAALGIREVPMLNSVLRFGNLYQRKSIDVFLQVLPDTQEDNLSGVLIRNCDQKDLTELAAELKSDSKRIKNGDDFAYKKMKGFMRWVPSLLVPPLMRFIGFIMYGLNIWSPLMNAPKDSFGSLMITSVGMMGIDNGFAPLVPYSRCPALLAVGEIRDKAVVVDGQIVIKPIVTIGVTLDHRHIDGRGAAFLLRAFRKYLANPT